MTAQNLVDILFASAANMGVSMEQLEVKAHLRDSDLYVDVDGYQIAEILGTDELFISLEV